MLNLVMQGPRMIAIRTGQQEAMMQYLTGQFTCETMEKLGAGIDTAKTHCVLCVVNENGAADSVNYLAVEQSVEYVLCHLMNPEAQQMIHAVRALPQIIIFNSLGEQKPVVDKMRAELQCERTGLDGMLHRENNEGVIVAFLIEDQPGNRKFYDEVLFADYDYASLMGYLRIHAPRYLAKAFAPDVWHMVDLRIFDRYEAYDLQYNRVTEAIKALKLGYIVTETWNREVSMFADPVGTYHIRLLTFLNPLELKKLLIGLEYSQGGSRIVDLDLFWHGKKISWKNLLDDKEIRKKIKKTASFFPKSSFFAVQNEISELILYCTEETAARMPETTKEILLQYEQQINQKANEQ